MTTLRLKLATWNVHRCVGIDGVTSPSRCAEVIREIGADIVVLQEIESAHHPTHDLLAYFASETYNHKIAGPTLFWKDSNYGNALLSRLPVTAVRHHNLSVAGREPRGAIDADIQIAGESVQIIATHLGLRPSERRDQVEALIPLFRDNNRRLVVLAGDLNEWFLWGRPLRRLHSVFSDTPHRRSWPARFPLFALDRIWVNPRAGLQSLEVHTSHLARVASDHLPLVANISLAT